MTESEEREHVNNAARSVVKAALDIIDTHDIAEESRAYLDEQAIESLDERDFEFDVVVEVQRLLRSIYAEL